MTDGAPEIRSGRIELAIAVILSLATLASTWSGYQAKQWARIQGDHQSAADTAERTAAEDTIISLQTRTFDGIVLLAYWTALREQDTATAGSLHAHMRPQLRVAVDASLAAGGLRDPTVAGPLERAEYALPEESDAKRLRDDALRLNGEAQKAGRVSGEYVLLTLLFASVLFFGGIAGSFNHRPIRIMLAGVSLVLFVIAMGMLAQLPIHTSQAR